MAWLRCGIFLLSCLLATTGYAISSDVESDGKAIVSVLKAQFEQPGNVLNVLPVTVVDDYAVVGWTQGAHGGRALLHKQNHQWVVQVCAGDALINEHELTQMGLDAAQARLLVMKQVSAEAQLPISQVQKFSLFEKRIMLTEEHGGK